MMNRKLLESYQANKRMVERNKKKIEDERCKDIPVVMGKVMGSSSEFPYTGRRFTVQMNEPAEADKTIRRIDRWEKEIKQATDDIEAVELFIAGITDARDREILTYHYIDGMKMVDVARLVGYTHGRISQIIAKYTKV